MLKKRRYMVICAHPDDMEVRLGGCAIKLTQQGHEVKVLCLTNGNAGHHVMCPSELADRRAKEAAAVMKKYQLYEYQILDKNDGYLQASHALRDEIIRAIRSFVPDLVFSFRTWDYHTDHRVAAMMVQDAAYLLGVPNICPGSEAMKLKPVILLMYDEFKKPCPFVPHAAVAIDSVMNKRLEMMALHESQFFEWLPYDQNMLDQVPKGKKTRLEWLKENWSVRYAKQADAARSLLVEKYGLEGHSIKYAEIFEISDYGRQPSANELKKLLPR